MKKILSFLLLSITLACSSSYQAKDESTVDHNDKRSRGLVGQIDRESLLELPQITWYKKNYSSYAPDEQTSAQLTTTLNEFQIKVFMGTWCHDSQREVPRLYKILDNTGYDLKNLNLVALDHNKSTPEQLEKGLGIKRTPTFVFFKDGVEVGRIVEVPRESLEKDILKIISGQEYKHSYQD